MMGTYDELEIYNVDISKLYKKPLQGRRYILLPFYIIF